ncbi:MAG: LysE family transporter [Candidatus Heimdallarchaeota archaeon]|nr:MAG: LysE family transporter [Candidatus Heimdallarchaeota archaeon]
MDDVINIWIFVAFLGFTLAAPLGPINAEVIKQALDKAVSEKLAWGSAIITGIGAMTGDFVVAFSALTIGGEILTDVFLNPIIKFLLFTVNIIILGFLGISALIAKQISLEDRLNDQNETLRSDYSRLVKQYITGFSIVVTSPWSYLWWVSMGTLILFSDLNVPNPLFRLGIVMMFLSGVLIWQVFFTTLLAVIGRLPNPKLFVWVQRGTAIILLGFAAVMVNEAILSLLDILYLK